MGVFVFRGRASRMEYFLHWLGGIVAYIGGVVLVVWAELDPNAPPWGKTAMAILFLLVILLVMIDDIAVTLRRLEDLGRPRSHFWLLLIPFYNIYLGLLLFFKPGLDNSTATLALAHGTSGTSPETNESAEYVCSRCGSEIKRGDSFCSGCGDTIEF
jgi:uncharacterized membrane protein YhaH (DUF805 family)